MMKRKTIAIAAAVMAGCLGTAPAAYAEYDAATVEQVQQALNDAGFDCGTPDGIAGEMTAAAIRAYEEANGLPADGEIEFAGQGILHQSRPGSGNKLEIHTKGVCEIPGQVGIESPVFSGLLIEKRHGLIIAGCANAKGAPLKNIIQNAAGFLRAGCASGSHKKAYQHPQSKGFLHTDPSLIP